MKKKFQCVFEGITKAGNPTLLNEIYTELYITEGGTGELNEEHEVRQIEAASRKADRAETSIRQEELFQLPAGRQEPIRTVMTKGVAGIGKTVLTQRFTLDWAEGKANQNIHFIFPFTFRELNVLKEEKFSLVELVHHFFPETKEAGICSFEDFQIIFIFDGLDECRLPLDFNKSRILTDPRKSTSVGILLTNLIRGNLLPSARLWITTRPAAANQIPAECVDMVTEVRGFNDPQKEEYFRKRFRDKNKATRIISHIKRSRSLHIMCHIPVFCWITATVLEDLLKSREGGELPKSLTEMYIHFLVVQAKVKKIKYDGGAETDPPWSPESRKMMESLGKLAFEQLQKGNLIFYESDLTECGIDIRAASVYSGVFTQIFREERGLYQDKVFCFIHLSVQEFLAALHVHLTFITAGVNLIEDKQNFFWNITLFQSSPVQFYQSAVNKALQSPNGHLDLFLRFLLGLSLQTNQNLLQGLLTQTGKEKFSLVELVYHFFPETKEAGICSFEDFQIIFIFDGLDECRLPLDFNKTQILTDPRKSTSVGDLLTNLIRGNLLPSARLWITTRPAAANQIPPGYVDTVTEVRGFNDPQKEVYFRKRFRDEEQARRIISHIKTSRSLHIMCHIPVFCWITATVLEDLLKSREGGELPKSLTEMYIHFLVVQAKVKKIKYDGGAETDPPWSPESRKMMESLAKLAFEQLQKGNLIFYESDLTECGIDIRAASVYSGVFTQIFREERGLYQDKVFCFIHLSVQEFLAALHIHLTFINNEVNLLEEQQKKSKLFKVKQSTSVQFYKSAVKKALQSPNGHLDLFLRFLLGLSLQTNQNLLRGLLTQTGSSSQTNQKTVQYIKKKISENLSAEKSINLFHCLNELNDGSLVEEIQQFLSSGSLSTDELSRAQWSALVFILLSSGEDLEIFDLKKYSASEEALLSLLPVIKASSLLNQRVFSFVTIAQCCERLQIDSMKLSGCNLSERSCAALSSVLSSHSSRLRDLDLSNNNLQDSGAKQLSAGLESPDCELETLSLSGCLITEEGCASLASALNSNPSHLRELDLSYNHPGEAGIKLLSAALEDPDWRLDTLRYGETSQWLTPGLKKYSCRLTIDINTVNRNLKLSDKNRKVTFEEELQSYPDHPDRFDQWYQLLCRDGLTGRCYWEVEWRGQVTISVSYRGIRREGVRSDCFFGENNQSWSLFYSDSDGFYVWHDDKKTQIFPSSSSSSSSLRAAVYVDCPAGTLSFFRVSSDSLIHLHTFNTTFTEPLYPGFGLWSDSSMVLS
uniref:B30.2/SPRY domain-containing protein n=1 Tax=Oryzias melastigma TaxID=30732 RepID=A0A3B3C7N4_ORYME